MQFPLQKRFVAATRRPEVDMNPEALEWCGLDNLCRSAKVWNRFRRHGEWSRRRNLYRHQFEDLLQENGDVHAGVTIEDGWAIDDACTFPHLPRVLAEAEQFIRERGGRPRTKSERGFIQDLLQPGDLDRWGSFLDFATSSSIVAPVCRYMKTIPMLSDLVPPGVRFVESTDAGQLDDGLYRHSQLYHLDFHDRPVVYVIVLLRDTSPDQGPFVFLPRSVSERLRSKVKYGHRKTPYRLSDEEVDRIVDRGEAKVLEGKKGTVCFLDSSACFHYGSRDSRPPRYQLMIAYVSPCRTDFADRYMSRMTFPTAPRESRLRRLLLGKAEEETA